MRTYAKIENRAKSVQSVTKGKTGRTASNARISMTIAADRMKSSALRALAWGGAALAQTPDKSIEHSTIVIHHNNRYVAFARFCRDRVTNSRIVIRAAKTPGPGAPNRAAPLRGPQPSGQSNFQTVFDIIASPLLLTRPEFFPTIHPNGRHAHRKNPDGHGVRGQHATAGGRTF